MKKFILAMVCVFTFAVCAEATDRVRTRSRQVVRSAPVRVERVQVVQAVPHVQQVFAVPVQQQRSVLLRSSGHGCQSLFSGGSCR